MPVVKSPRVGPRFCMRTAIESFRDIVSSRRNGLGSRFARLLLAGLAIPYTMAVERRNRAFNSGRRLVHRADVPVVSVGNITLGGTGKTPFVAMLARWFLARGVQPAIVSRGYGARGAWNDEALELAAQLPNVSQVQHRDRILAAETAVRSSACEVLLLDDGFQHRRLFRDLDIVLVDALVPDGFGHVFPRGLLREPWKGLSRAHVVVLTRCDLVGRNTRASIQDQVLRAAPHALWVETCFRPRNLLDAHGRVHTLADLQQARVAAFCGIGNPASFERTLKSIPCKLVALRPFPDHHAYSSADWDNLGVWARKMGADILLCTQKDLVKLPRDFSTAPPLRALVGEVQILVGQESLELKLESLVPPRCRLGM